MDVVRIYPNVLLASDVRLDDFVILGVPPYGRAAGELPLEIGEAGWIRSHSVIYAGTRIGMRFQTGHGALIREHCVIGSDVSIGSGSVVEFGVRIGDGVRLHSKVFVPEYSVLDNRCWLGPNVVVTNAKFPRSARSKELLAGVH